MSAVLPQAVSNEMPCLSAVETDPSIAIVGGDLACIALLGLHGVMAPELCVRGLWACHLRLGPILHWGLRSWCSIAKASWFLKAILLAGLCNEHGTIYAHTCGKLSSCHASFVIL